MHSLPALPVQLERELKTGCAHRSAVVAAAAAEVVCPAKTQEALTAAVGRAKMVAETSSVAERRRAQDMDGMMAVVEPAPAQTLAARPYLQ
jgi:hypothetical protein